MIIERGPKPESHRQKLRGIYNEINRVVEPGDVVFFVSERVEQPFSILRKIYRSWQGFDPSDNTAWHTSMFTEKRKEKKGATIRPYIVHAAPENGVEKIHIPAEYFISEKSEDGKVIKSGRIEVVRHPQVGTIDRQKLVDYVNSRIGTPFQELDWKHDFLTYAFGLPAKPLDPSKTSCHGLIFNAYQQIGITFGHQFEDAPYFNIGRYTGHPIGETSQTANLQRLHLHDHQLYNDERFICVLSVAEDPISNETLVTENPGKYSWHPELQKKEVGALRKVET